MERRTQHREAGCSCFPEQFSAVCKAGEAYEETKAVMDESRWARKPPAKRPEWRSFGTRNPFVPDWRDVTKVGHGKRHRLESLKRVQDHSDDGTSEEERLLNGAPASSFHPWLVVSPIADRLSLVAKSVHPPNQLLVTINAIRVQRSMTPLHATSASEMYRSALLHVQVEMLGRGSPGDMAIIYAISAEERGKWIHAHKLELELGRAGYLDPDKGDFPVSEIQKVSKRDQSKSA